MKNRLQIRYCKTVFDDRTAALNHINTAFERSTDAATSLIAEPLVCFYNTTVMGEDGFEKTVQKAFLAIGQGGRGENALENVPYFIIDITKSEEDIEAILADCVDIHELISKINTEISDLKKVDTASKTELEEKIAATRTAAGIDVKTGNYVDNGKSKYISGSTSLNMADVKLNDALSSENTERIEADKNLGKRIDGLMAPIGLTDKGTYVANPDSNYIKDATSLKNADDLIDIQVKKNADNIVKNKIVNEDGSIRVEPSLNGNTDIRVKTDNATILRKVSTEKEHEGELYVNVDLKTIVKDSEGKLSVNVDKKNFNVAENGVISVKPEAFTNYEGGKAISVGEIENNVRKINVDINPGESVLDYGPEGLKTVITLDWPTGSDFIYLKGKGGKELSHIPVASFVKDGILESAKIAVNPEGEEPGTYLALVWNTSAEKETMYINVSSLIDIYTSGNGINIDENRNVSIKIDAAGSEKDAEGNHYLSAGTEGLKISGINGLKNDLQHKIDGLNEFRGTTEQAISDLNGDESNPKSVANKVKAATDDAILRETTVKRQSNEYADHLVEAEAKLARSAEETNAKGISTLYGKIDIINGDGVGSFTKAVSDAKADAILQAKTFATEQDTALIGGATDFRTLGAIEPVLKKNTTDIQSIIGDGGNEGLIKKAVKDEENRAVAAENGIVKTLKDLRFDLVEKDANSAGSIKNIISNSVVTDKIQRASTAEEINSFSNQSLIVKFENSEKFYVTNKNIASNITYDLTNDAIQGGVEKIDLQRMITKLIGQINDLKTELDKTNKELAAAKAASVISIEGIAPHIAAETSNMYLNDDQNKEIVGKKVKIDFHKEAQFIAGE